MGFFDGVGSALVGGGFSLAGDIFGANSSAQSIADQMDFQAYMSNTSHQREVKDLLKAGLNPILSAKYGGASTPAGASMQYPNFGTNTVNSALQAKMNAAVIEKTKAETEAAENTAELTKAETRLKRIERDYRPFIYMADMQLKDAQSAASYQQRQLNAERTRTEYSNAIAAELGLSGKRLEDFQYRMALKIWKENPNILGYHKTFREFYKDAMQTAGGVLGLLNLRQLIQAIGKKGDNFDRYSDDWFGRK